MKVISLLLVALYLFLPVACLAHPCAPQGELPYQEASDRTTAAGENSGVDDPDQCETTCCCAGYLLFTPGSEPTVTVPTAQKTLFAPYLVLPRLIDRIFVPPQNLS